MTTALGIAPDSAGVGTDPLQLRKIIQARWANPGIVTGLGCAGRSDLRYQLSAGVAVCQRSTADGCTEAYWQGGTTPAVSVGDASNPRIDVVCIKANDPTQGDDNNQVTAVVVQGTPAVSPVVPTIPAGAVAVATMRMPAGATATNAAIVMAQPSPAIPYGASTGIMLNAVDTRNGIGTRTWGIMCAGSIFLPSARTIRIDSLTSALGVVPDVGTATDGSMHVKITVDDVDLIVWERKLFTMVTVDAIPIVTELAAGTHSIKMLGEDGVSGWQQYYSWSNGMKWPGQVLTVTDVCVS